MILRRSYFIRVYEIATLYIELSIRETWRALDERAKLGAKKDTRAFDETDGGEATDQNFPATDDPLPKKAGETVRTKSP